MEIKRIISNNFKSIDKSDDLYPLYENLNELVDDKDDEKIIQILNRVKKNYEKLIEKNNEEGKSTELYERAVGEIDYLLSKSDVEEERDEKPVRRVERVSAPRPREEYDRGGYDMDQFSEMEREYRERRGTELLNAYHIFGIIMASLSFIAGLTYAGTTNGATLFFTCILYGAMMFFLFFALGDLVRNQKRTNYILNKIYKKMK